MEHPAQPFEISEAFQTKLGQGLAAEEALADVLEASIRGLGYRYYSYIASHAAGRPVSGPQKPIFVSNYPSEWRSRYLNRDYHMLDPVVVVGGKLRRPYFWGSRSYVERLAARQRLFFGEARDFGIVHGMTIPVYGPDGECAVFSVSSDVGVKGFNELVAETAPLAQSLALQAHALAADSLIEDCEEPEICLTERERDCLLWTARGKTSWEIAQIIGRSSATVNYHLQKATRKLDAANKVEAAFIAHERRLLG